MRLKIIFSFLFLLIFINFIHPNYVLSQNEFITDAQTEYDFSDSGNVVITQTISIENAFTDLYVTSYSLLLDNIEVTNTRVIENGKNIDFTQKKEGSKTIIEIKFPDARVGKGKTRIFQVIYENSRFAQRTGEVWEISIPRLNDNSQFRNYSAILIIPNSFGNEAYLSPKPVSKDSTEGKKVYRFSKEDIKQTGITAGFGMFQVFSFTLNYHLENPLTKASLIEISIPPDTALQKMYYTNISPKPKNVFVDTDGNWIAEYLLKPRERADIKTEGLVQIFAGVRPFPKPSLVTLEANLKENEYWQVNDPKIKLLAEKLKTAKNIYDYVYQNLNYDYEKVKPNNERLGSVKALENPQSAICMEYTDLFVALARSAGIPAREVNGFAYTENPQIQPLSLVADVLHSWPEYWNEELKSWVAVDPTWASTTRGVDYFNKLDLRHFAFVMHGSDPQKPYPPGSYKLGANPQKDVFVNFGQLPYERESNPEINIKVDKSIPFIKQKYLINIKNPGPSALYNLTPTIFFDSKVNETKFIEVLPPFANYEIAFLIPFSFLGKNTPNTITITSDGSSVTIPTNKHQIIILSLILSSFILITIILSVLIKIKKISLFKIKYFFEQTVLRKVKNEGSNSKS